jgi:hypothetical protein
VSDPDRDFEHEVLRLNQRYLTEVVERFALCPWALRARLDGAVVQRVFGQDSGSLFDPSLRELASLARRQEIEIGLFIYPRIALPRLEFEHYVRHLRALDDARYPAGEVPFAMAAFHPDATPDLSDPQRLIPFLRRTPYPTIQVVRSSALERVRGGADEGTAFLDLALVAIPAQIGPVSAPLRQRIAERNLATVEKVGPVAVERAVADILRDRDETHARLARTDRA